MAITRTPNRVIEGDDIQEQIDALPELMYLTRTNPNNPAIWETYNPKTGEIIDTGTFAGGGDKGLLAAAAPVIGLAASTVGLPFISSLLGGATGLTGSALAGATGATIGAGTQAVTGGSTDDILRAALLGGGGAYLGSELNNYLKYQNMPVDFNTMSTEQINDALDVNFRNDLARAGLSDAQIKSFLANPASIYDATQIVNTPATTTNQITDSGTVSVTAPNTSLNNVLGTVASNLPAVTVTAPKTTQQVDQSVLNQINSQLSTNLATPSNTATVTVTGQKPPVTTQEIINSIISTLPPLTNTNLTTTSNLPTVTVTGTTPPTVNDVIVPATTVIPTVTTPETPKITVTETKKPEDGGTEIIDTFKPPTVTTSDVIKIISTIPAIAAINSATKTPTNTMYPIVDVPASWGNPPKTGVAPFTPLTPIDFGNRNLLIGTQWEKFLDPNYGKVPEPVQYSQPSNLSYNDLMGILGSKQGMPPASSLSINDIISGIQNQYGQASRSTMG